MFVVCCLLFVFEEESVIECGFLTLLLEVQNGASWFASVFKSRKQKPKVLINVEQEKRHVYLYGTVGTGKSFVMDLFYDVLTDKRFVSLCCNFLSIPSTNVGRREHIFTHLCWMFTKKFITGDSMNEMDQKMMIPFLLLP